MLHSGEALGRRSQLWWPLPLSFSCCTLWNHVQTAQTASASTFGPLQRGSCRAFFTWASCMLKMWIMARKGPRHMFVSFLMGNVPCNTVNINYKILYSSILNKMMPEVKDFPYTLREFLFICLEYCSHFLFIGFSTELKKVFWFELILTFCLCLLV